MVLDTNRGSQRETYSDVQEWLMEKFDKDSFYELVNTLRIIGTRQAIRREEQSDVALVGEEKVLRAARAPHACCVAIC